MEYVNLFGEPVDLEKLEKRQKRSNEARGYAAKPGTRPEGETCRTCQHSETVEGYSN